MKIKDSTLFILLQSLPASLLKRQGNVRHKLSQKRFPTLPVYSIPPLPVLRRGWLCILINFTTMKKMMVSTVYGELYSLELSEADVVYRT